MILLNRLGENNIGPAICCVGLCVMTLLMSLIVWSMNTQFENAWSPNSPSLNYWYVCGLIMVLFALNPAWPLFIEPTILKQLAEEQEGLRRFIYGSLLLYWLIRVPLTWSLLFLDVWWCSGIAITLELDLSFIVLPLCGIGLLIHRLRKKCHSSQYYVSPA